MKLWTRLFFRFTLLINLLIFSSCELLLFEPLQLIARLEFKYLSNSASDKLTLGDMESNTLITVSVPDKLEGAGIPDANWLLTIHHDATVFAFEGVLKFESPITKEQSIGPGSGKQLKTGDYAKADWTPNTLFGFTDPVSVTLRLEANGQFTTKNFPGIKAAALEIHTWQDLQAMQHRLGGTFTVMKDIYFPEPGFGEFPREGFSPIGDHTSPFKGKLLGAGKTISNFFIYQRDDNYVGLFGALENATTESFSIELVSVEGNSSVGVLAGSAKGSTISDVHVRGGNIKGTTKVGGLIGTCLDAGCSIERVSILDTTVSASSQVGGMIGHIEQGSIKNSYTSGGTVDGSRTNTITNMGGMIGSLGKAGNRASTVSLQNIYTANEINPLRGSYVALFLGRSLFQSTMQAPTAYYCGTTTTGNTIGVDPQIISFSGAILRINPEELEKRGDGNYYIGTNQVFTGWDFKTIWQWNQGSCPVLK